MSDEDSSEPTLHPALEEALGELAQATQELRNRHPTAPDNAISYTARAVGGRSLRSIDAGSVLRVRKRVVLAAGVEAAVRDGAVIVKGKLGTLEHRLPRGIQAKVDGGKVIVTREGESKQARSLHGLTRAIVRNMVEGVTKGYEKQLEIVGVSYQAALAGNAVRLKIGLANDLVFPIPPVIAGDSASSPAIDDVSTMWASSPWSRSATRNASTVRTADMRAKPTMNQGTRESQRLPAGTSAGVRLP